MAEDWKELEKEVVSILAQGVSDFAHDVKDTLAPFLKEKAAQIAKYKWKSLHADSEEEKDRAKQMMRHLVAQVKSEIAQSAIEASDRTKEMLGKVFEVATDAVSRIVPKLLGFK